MKHFFQFLSVLIMAIGISSAAISQTTNDFAITGGDISPKAVTFPSTHSISLSLTAQNKYTVPSIGTTVAGKIGVVISINHLDGATAAISGTLASKLTWSYVSTSRSFVGRWKAREVFDAGISYTLTISGLNATSERLEARSDLGFNANLTPPANIRGNNQANDNTASFTFHSPAGSEQNLITKASKADVGGRQAQFRVYPTVINAIPQVTMELISMEQGKYSVQVFDMQGRVLQTQAVMHEGGSAAQLLRVPATLPAGRYNIRLTGQNNQSYMQAVIKQ
ncbi:MAG: T9SS type A sorting domain-containing protein [Chitinophagaceae bacterium]|jgi:hypothetical protein|nr:T9SS type A sorting domain-containing protein [Chitinophagaceae bacterium]